MEKINIIKTISNVASELAKNGIAKNQVNTFQKYKFRGIDDLYNALSPAMCKHGLVILPNITQSTHRIFFEEKDKRVFEATVNIEYTLLHTHGEDKLVINFTGVAFDTSDKAMNKAMSSCYKYMAIQLFAIPIVGDDDADKNHIELKPQVKAPDFKLSEDAQIKFDYILTLRNDNMLKPNHIQEMLNMKINYKDKGLVQEYEKALDNLVESINAK